MTVDRAAFRRAVGHIPTAVSVITTTGPDGEPWGVTVGALCSLSVQPPMILFCLEKATESHAVLTTSAWFLVHVLADDQAWVAARFARRGNHRFAAEHETVRGLPAIPGVLARLHGQQAALTDGGDHTIVIGHVEDIEVSSGRPLLYQGHAYRTLADLPEEAGQVGTGIRIYSNGGG